MSDVNAMTKLLKMFVRQIGLAMLAATLASAAAAQSGVITDDYIGCLTEENLNQLFKAINSNDTRLRDSLMGKVCVLIKGYPFSMLDRGMLVSEIRIYVNDTHIDLFVPAEAAR